MSDDELAGEVLASLGRGGMSDAEVYLKTGRSRRFELGSQGRISSSCREGGWAVRAGGRLGSFFVAGTGRPSPDLPWPEPQGRSLRLPGVVPAPAWREPEGQDSALASEIEAVAQLEGIERKLHDEIPGSRLLHAVLEEGSSRHRLVNSRGVAASWRSRTASLQLEAAGPRPRSATARLFLAERELRGFSPAALARRLANALWIHSRGEPPPERERGEMVLAPPVAARLLHGLLPLLVGPGAAAVARGYRDRRGRLGAERLTVVDDGRYPGGALEAPVDGEGTPTRRVGLIEEGVWRQALVSWQHSATISRRPAGCVRRPSWRDEPRVAPSHLFIAPEPQTVARDLVASVARGFYLAEARGAARVDLGGNRFSLPVCGFTLLRGRAAGPVSEALLCGSVRSLLNGIRAVARDLAFEPLEGLVGAPTILVTGLEIRRASPSA